MIFLIRPLAGTFKAVHAYRPADTVAEMQICCHVHTAACKLPQTVDCIVE